MRARFWVDCLTHSKQYVNMLCGHIILRDDYVLIEDMYGKAHKYYLRKISGFEVVL